MDEEKDWKTLAIEKQLQFFETLGSRSYDEIEKTNLFLLKKKVGFATCGKPSDLPNSSNFYTGYCEGDLKHIKDICEKIVEKSEYDPIRFACTVLILYHKNAICETSVFRIGTEKGNIFIDAHGRVYQNWKQFMEENKLPDCEYCYPLDGIYNAEKEALIGFAYSPASSFFNQATDCLDTAGAVVSVAAAAVFAVSTFAAVAPVVVAAAGTSAACTGVYSITRSVSSLYDRNKHGQSVGIQDPESRSAWMAIGSSAVGVATLGAIGKAQKVIESGESLSKLSVFGMHALTTSSLVFSGFGFIETLFICADKYNKGILTKKDVFDLSCELLFLFNAIASAKATTNLVNNMSATAASTEPSAQKKLTKTQKRNLRKRAAKRRAKGYNTNTNPEPNTSSEYKSTITLLLLEAVRAYAPRVEEVMYNCQSIYHDILCWKTREMSDVVFMKNIVRSILRLYDDYKDEISEAMNKVVKYFTSFNLSKVMEDIFNLYCDASEELRTIFCTKIITMEDQIESLISEAERDVTGMYDQLKIEVDNTPESVENSEELDEDDLNSESQRLLSGCGSVIAVASLSCKDLEECGDILDGVKLIVVSEFKTKLSDYIKKLEAAKTACGDSFDVNSYHKVLGINGDICQHMFNETLKDLLAERTIYKIKCKCKDIQKEKSARTTPIWEALYDGMFHYYGPHGSGDLSMSNLLSIVNCIVTEAEVTEKKCSKLLKEGDVVMIEVPDKDGNEIHIIVYCGITEENTASGIIIIAK